MEWPPKSGVRATFPELDRVEWLGSAAAAKKIVAGQRELLERLAERDLI
jgi:predicted NUDIX family NTP pyrophosphohydrolase